MNLLEAGDKIQVAPDYEILIAPGEYLFLEMLTKYGVVGITKFDHPSVLIKKHDIYEFKHYRHNAGKYWTQAIGYSFVFGLHKSRIEITPAKGYSYVAVEIGGRTYTLNVSGGGGGGSGWTDYVGGYCHVCGSQSLESLQHLASIGTPYTQLAGELSLDIDDFSEGQQEVFIEMAARYDVLRHLDRAPKHEDHGGILKSKGRGGILKEKIWLATRKHFSWGGGVEGPFLIECRPKRQRWFRCIKPMHFYSTFKVPYKTVNWTETAKLNNIPLIEPGMVNRVGKVLEPKP